jgi:hypothetical protein
MEGLNGVLVVSQHTIAEILPLKNFACVFRLIIIIIIIIIIIMLLLLL